MLADIQLLAEELLKLTPQQKWEMAVPIPRVKPSLYTLDPEDHIFPCQLPCNGVINFDYFLPWTVLEIKSCHVYVAPDWCTCDNDDDGTIMMLSYKAHLPICCGETTMTGNTLLLPQEYKYSLINEFPCCLVIGGHPKELLLYRV